MTFFGEPRDMKPLIGITMNLEEQSTRDLNILDQAYGRAVYQAGGFPVPILGIEPSIPELVKRLELGVVLPLHDSELLLRSNTPLIFVPNRGPLTLGD